MLGLLSFHRNGFVRQEAVQLLATDATGEELFDPETGDSFA
jgi:hypothetical protein